MKVTCPGCNSSYRVADEKVPPSGAKIKCPKCQVTFVVHRQESREQPNKKPADLPRHEQLTPIEQLVSETPQAPSPTTQAPANTTPVSAPAKAPGVIQARGVSAIRAQSGAVLESYKVKTASGLVYDFATREAMVQWLAARQDAATCLYAEPGGGWLPAETLLAAKPATQTLIALTPGQPLASPPQISTAVRAEKQRSPAIVMALAAVLVWLGAMAGAAATVTRYGIFDASKFLSLSSFGIVFPKKNEPPAAPKTLEEDPERIYATSMQNARQAMQKGRYSKAALEFNRALTVKAGAIEALEGYALACEKLGDVDRARAIREKIKSLQQ